MTFWSRAAPVVRWGRWARRAGEGRATPMRHGVRGVRRASRRYYAASCSCSSVVHKGHRLTHRRTGAPATARAPARYTCSLLRRRAARYDYYVPARGPARPGAGARPAPPGELVVTGKGGCNRKRVMSVAAGVRQSSFSLCAIFTLHMVTDPRDKELFGSDGHSDDGSVSPSPIDRESYEACNKLPSAKAQHHRR